MRFAISKEQYIEARSHDLVEIFEVMVQHRFYLDVLCASGLNVISRLMVFSVDAGVFETSAVHALTDEQIYESDFVMTTHFAYNNVEQARAHAIELLSYPVDFI